MSIYYKYCNQLGALKVLGNLQLKLPYILDVNDPLECRPHFVINTDFVTAKEYWLSLPQHNGLSLGDDFDTQFESIFNNEETLKNLKTESQNRQDEWNKNACLLSVSGSPSKTVMWTHYGNWHKGAVIGFNFEEFNIHPALVNYSLQRPPFTLFKKISDKELLDCLLTKSESWRYENEYREIFVEKVLRELEPKGWVCNKDFEGKKTWFLRLRPMMVKEVVFGLYADVDFKIAIRRIVNEHIREVKFFQTRISEDKYDLELTPID